MNQVEGARQSRKPTIHGPSYKSRLGASHLMILDRAQTQGPLTSTGRAGEQILRRRDEAVVAGSRWLREPVGARRCDARGDRTGAPNKPTRDKAACEKHGCAPVTRGGKELGHRLVECTSI
jgi:hypothetical protein